MNIEISKLASTEERIKILEEILYLSEVKVSETARKLNLSKGLVSKYFDILVNEKMLKKKENIFLIANNSKTKAMKIMLNVLSIPQIFSKYKFVKAVGLYGSSAKGTNTKESDIDLWIKIEKTKDEEIAKLNSELSNKIEGVALLVLTDEKIKELKKSDLTFYHSLYFGSIILYGEENEI